MKKLFNPLALGLSMLILTSCGGSGLIAEGGIGGTGIVMGRVSGFGSLFVNGVEFDTSNSTFIYEGETGGDQSGIRVGMVVRITGEDDGVTGVAEIVEYASLFEGTLTSKTIASNETGILVAMGQNVTVDADTVYDDSVLPTATPLSQLPLGTVIEVSGFSDGNGNVLATRIEVKALSYGGETLDVKALVSSLDTTNKTFTLGSLSIDYSAIALPDGIVDGIYVEAKGTLQGDTLFASDVQIEDGGDLVIAADGEEAELEGLVTGTLTATADSALITVNGQQVLVDANTQFESGDVSNLTIGQPLEVSGVMDGSTLVAASVVLKVSEGLKEELEGIPSNVDPTAGTLTLLNQTIRVSTSTIFEDDLSEDSQTFNLSSLTPGVDYISVDLYQATDGVLQATKVERDENPSEDPGFAEVEGYVQAVDNTQITAVNVTIDISDPSLSGFSPIDGDRVEIFGLFDSASGILQATSVSIDID
jgi:hypothetical protein